MTTGTHTVRDIYCVKCNQVLGWKYVRFLCPIPRSLANLAPPSAQERAFEASQKYKEGKYILERNLLTDVQ